jgi:hypothetical protein
MAEIGNAFASQSSVSTTSNATWVDILTLGSGNFSSSTEYLIIAYIAIEPNSAQNQAEARLVHGSTPTAFSDSAHSHEVGNAACSSQYFYFTKFTQPGTAEDVKIQGQASDGGTSDYRWGAIFAMELTDLSSGTDYLWNEDTTGGVLDTGWTTYATTGAFTPGGSSDWMVMINESWIPSSVQATVDHRIQRTGEASTTFPEINSESDDSTNDTIVTGNIGVYSLTGTSNTFNAQHKRSNTTGTTNLTRSAIFALDLGAFNKSSVLYTASDVTMDATDYNTQVLARSLSDPTSGALVLATWVYNSGNVSSDAKTRLQDDATTDVPMAFSGERAIDVKNATTANEPGFHLWKRGTWSGSKTFDVDASATSSGRTARRRTMLIVDLELAGAPPAGQPMSLRSTTVPHSRRWQPTGLRG